MSGKIEKKKKEYEKVQEAVHILHCDYLYEINKTLILTLLL
jgi:hypothetical protein